MTQRGPESSAGGSVNPDEWLVWKRGLARGAPEPIVRRHLGEKAIKRVYSKCVVPLRARLLRSFPSTRAGP